MEGNIATPKARKSEFIKLSKNQVFSIEILKNFRLKGRKGKGRFKGLIRLRERLRLYVKGLKGFLVEGVIIGIFRFLKKRQGNRVKVKISGKSANTTPARLLNNQNSHAQKQ